MPFVLDYSTTRSFTFRCFTPVILVFSTLWLLVITIVNVVAVGYEIVPLTASDYNASTPLWYESFIPTFWLAPSRQCDPSLIPVGSG